MSDIDYYWIIPEKYKKGTATLKNKKAAGINNVLVVQLKEAVMRQTLQVMQNATLRCKKYKHTTSAW